jgi:hypothetical protein
VPLSVSEAFQAIELVNKFRNDKKPAKPEPEGAQNARKSPEMTGKLSRGRGL